MSSVLNHKGYQARIEFDADDRVMMGRIAGIDDIVNFQADTVEGLIAAFRESVDDYIETCAKIGKSPEKAYSGNVYLRVDEATHAKAAKAADLAGLSLNQFGEEALQAWAEHFLNPYCAPALEVEDDAMQHRHLTSA